MSAAFDVIDHSSQCSFGISGTPYHVLNLLQPLEKEITQIEKVQRHFTKRLHGLRNVGYTERLNHRGLPTLELHCLQLDLIFCYKIVFSLSLTCSNYFQFSNKRNTRGHAYKLYKPQNFRNIRRNFFTM